MLRAGADKVSINTAAVKNPEFIREASLKFGSSTIVVAIEAIRQSDGKYLAYTDNGREESGLEVVSWAKRVEDLGAGEIVITSVDKEGTGEGFDLNLVKMVAAAVSIPVIAHGGCSGPEDAAKIIMQGHAEAIAVSSILHYCSISEIEKVNGNFEVEGNTSFMESGLIYRKIKPSTIQEIKSEMKNAGISVRF